MNVDSQLDDLFTAFAKVTSPNESSSEAASSDPVRWCQFKPHRTDDNQVQRRNRILKDQYRSRNLKLSERRKAGPNKPHEKSPNSRCLRYGDNPDLLKPMLSEWMLTVPQELESEWLLLFCPIGRRNMVVSSGGVTRVYSKAGKQVMQFNSSLPSSSDSATVIDCIFSQADLTFYVLDILSWKGTLLDDTEAECRQFFLRSRFSENPYLSENGVHNSGYRFVLVPIVDNCSPGVVAKALSQQPSSPVIDGLLFYHKQAHYTHDITPTVLWLRPFMLPTTLGVDSSTPDKQQDDDKM